MSDAAERRIAAYSKVEILIDRIDHATLLQRLHVSGDRRNRLHRADVMIRRKYVQCCHVLAEQSSFTFSDRLPVFPQRDRSLQQRVIDIGDVLDVENGMSAITPGTLHHVEGHIGRGMTHVSGVVGRDATDIHTRRALRIGGPNGAGTRIHQ